MYRNDEYANKTDNPNKCILGKFKNPDLRRSVYSLLFPLQDLLFCRTFLNGLSSKGKTRHHFIRDVGKGRPEEAFEKVMMFGDEKLLP